MKIVIQCAGQKQADAGHLTDSDGNRILFVAEPETAPPDQGIRYARPDDIAKDGQSWREELLAYNQRGDNPLALCPAYKLYENDTYQSLVNRYGTDNVFILSAGWGLITADFLTPNYDITFSPSARNENEYKRRGRQDNYHDFYELRDDDNDDLIFFGGKDYQPLFLELTNNYRGNRFVYYNSATTPDMPGCILCRYKTKLKTNWQYRCAMDFVQGRIGHIRMRHHLGLH